MSRKCILLLVLLALAGCVSEVQETLEICPGKENVTDALDVIQLRLQNLATFQARGNCSLQYYANSKKQRENLSVRIAVKSPFEIYLRGDVSVVPKALELGSNEREFWVGLRPNEISTYYWGLWEDLDSADSRLINPKTLLEALGIAQIDIQDDWSLENEEYYDILTKREEGNITEKIYFYCCDYSIRKIEHFNSYGQIIASAELAGYKEVTDDFSIPSQIDTVVYEGSNIEDSFTMNFKLTSIQQREFTESQNSLFRRFPPKGYETMYKLENGRWIEQPL